VSQSRSQHNSLNTILHNRPLLMDGGMGTQIFAKKPTADDYGGTQFEGCVELLNETRPHWISEIHENYFKAGADAVETNTFGCNAIVLGEFGIVHRAFELNKMAVENARRVAESFQTPKFVVASVGPGSKLRTLGHVSYSEMYESYLTQMRGLMAGKPHAILLETAQDIAQIKIAVRAANSVFTELRTRIPIWVQVTVEASGTLLLGTDVAAALVAIESLGVDSIGMNCATGPSEMRTHLTHLCENASTLVSCQPNAGLPINENGKTVYPLDPADFAKHVVQICKPLGVNILGGCCGTTPAHIAALAEHVNTITPRKPARRNECFVSSLYGAVSLTQDPRPLFVGERTNANGSKLFKDKLKENDFDAMVSIAKSQLKEGAHVLDVSVASVSRDEVSDMETFVSKLATQVNIPLMIDSTEVAVIEKALQSAPGKCIVNSINLEDGEAKARSILQLCKTYGASVVALTIDEKGMAKTVSEKLAIAKRLVRLATEDFGLHAGDVIIDALTFTLGSGSPEWQDSAVQTLDAIARIKTEIPGVKTILGLSNVSFGLAPQARQILNSLMLFHAVNKGLDLAILNASKILPLTKISQNDKELFEALLLNKREKYAEPIKLILAQFTKDAPQAKTLAQPKTNMAVEERLQQAIVDGDKPSVSELIAQALTKHSALHIINAILLEGMKIVGERFGKGEIQLPFVLESAETMKAAIACLEPHLEKSTSYTKGKIVLATVKGDVHDIGKNLVDIILSNNGFNVVNLGIKQSVEDIIAAYKKEQPQAIGLSGLLVKSTAIMKDDLIEMRTRGITVPVILGGAALTREFVETECRAAYNAPVYYAEDAFEGLRIMNVICEGKSHEEISLSISQSNVISSLDSPPEISVVRKGQGGTALNAFNQSDWVKHTATPPVPRSYGTHIFHDSVASLLEYLDEFSLVRSRWGFEQGNTSEQAFNTVLQTKAFPLLQSLKKRILDENLFSPAAIAGFFPACSGGDGNDIVVYDEHTKPNTPLSERKIIARFSLPRQKQGHRLCISDFLRHEQSDTIDVLGVQVVTMGASASEEALKHYSQGEFSQYFYLHGLSTELAEAYAELVHRRLRQQLGIHSHDAQNMRELFSQGYQGSRYSFGYPACPNLEANKTLLTLLGAERIGIRLSESFQMIPEQSTSALVLWHPQARYFSV
jgi:5-methyltetrahydrofolate--homocysteine methyltransferase